MIDCIPIGTLGSGRQVCRILGAPIGQDEGLSPAVLKKPAKAFTVTGVELLESW